MNKLLIYLFLLFSVFTFAQKDSLNVGDSYADDQLYASITYNQLYSQPNEISRSAFSYGFSTGFIKDIILNKQGNFSFGIGVGYGFDFYNHELKVDEINGETFFSSDNTLTANKYTTHNLEFPLELRWRTSKANTYKFWRIYTGVKFLYNFSNTFEYSDANGVQTSFSNINAYNRLQYGFTFSAGYDAFNFHIFYGLTPTFNEGSISSQNIDTKTLKFGLIFYLL